MPGFLYFVNGQNPSVPDSIRYAFESSPQIRECLSGPDQRSGSIFADKSTPVQNVKFDPNSQCWERIPNSEIWVGIYPDNPPTEQSLRKSVQLDGYLVPLGNGENWNIPIARTWNDQGNYITRLPCVVGVDASGKIYQTDKIVAEYRELWDTATEIFEGLKASLLESEDSETKLLVDYPSCFRVISSNYRVSPIEISMLELVNTRNAWSIANALIDLAAHPFLTVKKNEESRTLNSGDGSEGNTRPTVLV